MVPPAAETADVLISLAWTTVRGNHDRQLLDRSEDKMGSSDKAAFADKISSMEEKLAEKEGSELDRAIERLDHFKSIQHQLNSTALH